MEYKNDVFISYSSEDFSVAEEIARALRQGSMNVWFDRWRLQPGDRWRAAIHTALASAKAFVLVVGSKGLSSFSLKEATISSWRKSLDGTFRTALILAPGASLGAIQSRDFAILGDNFTVIDFRDKSPRAIDELLRFLNRDMDIVDESFQHPSVFLCHAKEDSERVKELYFSLVDEGLDPWYDKEKLIVGQNFEKEIIDSIESSDFFAILFSTKSVQKTGYVNKEIRTAVREYQRRPFGMEYLLPIKLEECIIPRIKLDESATLQDLHWIDLFEGDGSAIRKFASNVRLLASKRESENA